MVSRLRVSLLEWAWAKPPYIVLLQNKIDYITIILVIYFAEFVDTGEKQNVRKKGIRKAPEGTKCSFKGGQKDENFENQRII